MYISLTGLQLKKWWYFPLFFRHALLSYWQAQKADGNISVFVKNVGGYRCTMTVWESRRDMLSFLYHGHHKRAIQIFPLIATGRTCGFESDEPPDWDDVPKLLNEFGVEYL